MLNVVSRLLRNLLPTGIVWRLFGDTGKLIDGIGTFFNRQKQFVEATLLESRPGTSVYELQNWYRAFGVTYNETLPLQQRQARAKQLFTSIGGQSVSYLRQQIQIAFPEIDIVEYEVPFDSMAGRGMAGLMQATNYPAWVPIELRDGTFPVASFRVTGNVESPEEFTQLQDIIARIFPAHLTPFYQDILFFPETMMAGYGRAGRGMAGRYPNQEPVDPILLTYTETDGLLFTSRHARFDGLGFFDGKTLLNPQANYNITTVKLGDGTTTPDPSDTDLESVLLTAPCVITTNPNGTRIYRLTVSKADLVGETISEAGLFGSGGMIWRHVFTGVPKTNEDIVIFEFSEAEIF